MMPHQERVVSKRDELNERLIKLAQFISGNVLFRLLSDAEQERMRRQRSVMTDYYTVLQERIDAFTE